MFFGILLASRKAIGSLFTVSNDFLLMTENTLESNNLVAMVPECAIAMLACARIGAMLVILICITARHVRSDLV